MKQTLTALIALALASATAAAQTSYGLGAGVSTPFGDFGKLAERGYHLTGLVSYIEKDEESGFRADASFSQFTYRNTQATTDASVRILSSTVDVIHRNPGLTGLFTIVGIGLYHASSVCASCSTQSTKVGFNFGGQYKLWMGNVNGFAEMRFHYIPGAMDPTTGGVKSGTGFIPVSFVLQY